MQTLKPRQNWYAIYVRSRSEKKVLADLTEVGIEAYVPLQKRLRQWKDRRKLVDMPLFNGYVFVHISGSQYDKVLNNTHVVCYVRFNGRPAIIKKAEIDLLKRMTGYGDHTIEVTTQKLKPGQRVEVIAGPMCGVKGELIAFRGKNKIALRIPPLGYTILIEAPEKKVIPELQPV